MGGLLKFTGVASPALDGVPTSSFLADFGIGLGASFILSTSPSYPLAVAHALRNLAANVKGFVVPDGSSIVFELLQNGAPVAGFTITYGPGESGIKTIAAGPVAYAIGDTVDVRVIVSGDDATTPVNVSATVGIE